MSCDTIDPYTENEKKTLRNHNRCVINIQKLLLSNK